MSGVVGLPTRFFWNLNDGEVSVIWIVKVTGVVDVYHSLVGRSRSGGVGRVEETGDVRSAGGWSVLMFSEHSVFEGYGQEHDLREEGMEGMEEDGGRERTEGRMTYLYTGRVAQNAVLASNALSFIFHQGPTAISRFGFPFVILLFLINLKFDNLTIFIFRFFPMPNSDSYNASLYL